MYDMNARELSSDIFTGSRYWVGVGGAGGCQSRSCQGVVCCYVGQRRETSVPW